MNKQTSTWTAGNVLTVDAGGNTASFSTSGSGAPSDATYVTLSTNGTLSNERVLTEGTYLDLTDAGAGSTITVAVDPTEINDVTFGNASDPVMTWTWNVLGTDVVIEFGAASYNVTSGGIQQAGVPVALSDATYLLLTSNSQNTADRTFTAGAGVAGTDAGANSTYTLATASDEADFIKSGALTCGASTQGKAQVHTTPLQYCDNAGTPTLRYAAYGNSSGESTAAANDSVALTTDTTGNYVATVTASTALTGTGCSAAEGATCSLAVTANGIGPTQIDETATYTWSAATTTFTGNVYIDNMMDLRLGEADANGSNYFAFMAPSSIASDVTFTWAATGQCTGTNGGKLTIDASNNITCSDDTSGGVVDATYVTLTTNGTLTNERTAVFGNGIVGVDGGAGGNLTISTASSEAGFLTSGALTCGSSTQGKMQVHTTPLQYCDGAGTPALQYAAYANSSGEATAAANDSVALTTDTTGNYVAGITASTSLSGSGCSGSEGASCTLSVTADGIGPTQIDETANYEWSGPHGFSGQIEVPNSNTPPTTDCDQSGEAGRLYVDNDASPGARLRVCAGTSGWEAGSGLGGAGTDNVLARWDGTAALQNSTITVDDLGLVQSLADSTATSGTVFGLYQEMGVAPSGSSTGKYIAVTGYAFSSNANAITSGGELVGLYAISEKGSTGSVHTAIGVDADVQNNSASGTITDGIGVRVRAPSGVGTTTNNYGVLIKAQGDYGVYAEGANDINYFAGKVGVGTNTIPHGAVGGGILAIDGVNATLAGPHIQVTTTSDDYPILQFLNWSHDNISIGLDMYWSGSNWTSSDAGSNFQLYKLSDRLDLKYAYGVTAGSTASMNNALSIADASGTKEVVINDGSADLNFRVESDTNANAIALDASSNALDINANTTFGSLLAQTVTHTSTPALAIFDYRTLDIQPSSATTTGYYGLYAGLTASGSNALNSGSSVTGVLLDVRSSVSAASASTVLTGINAGAFKSGTGNHGTAYGGYFAVGNTNATGTLTNAYGVYIADSSTTGTITNDWALYTAGTEPSRFGGPVGIGVSSITSGLALQLKQNSAGTEVMRIETEATNDNPTERIYQPRVTSSGTSQATLWDFTVGNDSMVAVEATVYGHCTAGSACTADQSATYMVLAGMKNDGGTATTLAAPTQIGLFESDAAWNASWFAGNADCGAANKICFKVNGTTNYDVVWHGTIRVYLLGT
ncbi:MAG: beta strand repeat-containing protein [Bradyrhizobium sp.]|uniref:beta strand repeat-containing protein n=1 Tax=Bradyrhizobium sp. TaxID=376 RepID=UPI003D108750